MKILKKFYQEVGRENTSSFLKELRSKAERLVKPQAMASLSNLTMDDIAGLVHELETHQIELEMQNEELKQTQDELEQISHEYSRLYQDAPVGLISIDQKSEILKSNVAATSMLNIPYTSTSKVLMTSFIMDEDQDVFYRNKQQALASLNRESCELRIKTITGEPLWVRLDSICDLDPYRIENNKIRLVLMDISDQKSAETELVMEKKKAIDTRNISSELNEKLQTQLLQMDVLDHLTNLPNRSFINEQVYITVSQARKQGEPVGLMIINVDNFLLNNEPESDLLGDVAVVETASIIKDCVREFDIVGCWGDSKFLVILTQKISIEALEAIARNILSKANTPKISLILKALNLSIGLALLSNHEETAANLISQAESAMLKAVTAGGNQYLSNS